MKLFYKYLNFLKQRFTLFNHFLGQLAQIYNKSVYISLHLEYANIFLTIIRNAICINV